MPHLTPLYSDDPDALADARGSLLPNSREAIPEWLKNHPPLMADLRAQATSEKSRPCRRAVALKVVFIDESGRGQGRLGELLMEQIADATATGKLYPAASMAGVCADAPWDGALTAAFWYARDCGFGIAPGTDVRWSVRVLPPGRNWDEHIDELCFPRSIEGRSAGVAFFLGLFALAQAEGESGGWKAREVVERTVALATLPDTDARAVVDSLGTLGGEETRKLAVLADLPAATRVVVVFPAAYTGSVHGRHESLAVTTVAGLVKALWQRCAGATRPDSMPATRRASRYVGGSDELRRLTNALRAGGLHIVSGTGGVGKTARVAEAAETLWRNGEFSGGRFWIDLYGGSETGRTSEMIATEAIAVACGEKPAERLDDLRAQTRRLLAGQSGILLLEGAETVAEGNIAALLDLFPGSTTVVWMTRRETDALHSSLRNAGHHPVRPLSLADALELLCYSAEREVEKLPTTEQSEWQEIADSTERLPLLLAWAGEALRPDRLTTATQYLAELRADPLVEIADPDGRERRNAGRFLRRSLARIVPTEDMPDLPAVAEHLFAGLAAFHPSHGAPHGWWPLTAGLDANKSQGRRRFAAARRALLGLGLVTAEAGGAMGETLHAVHALAANVATDLWCERSATQCVRVLGTLFHAAAVALDAPLPPQWFRDPTWIAGRTAQAAHYGHWLCEMEALSSQLDPADLMPGEIESFPDAALLTAWATFLDKHAEPQPLLGLKDVAWRAVCHHFEQMVSASPETPRFQSSLAGSWRRIGEVCGEREDWMGAKVAFQEALSLSRALAEAHPDETDFQFELAKAWHGVGKVCRECEEWVSAEAAIQEALMINKKLVDANPDDSGLQDGLAISWDRLGQIRMRQDDLPGAEVAFNENMAINRRLAEKHPGMPEFQDGLSISWDRLSRVRLTREDWNGAEAAFNEALALQQRRVETNPDEPNFRRGLSVLWVEIGDLRKAQQNWAGAEAAFNNAIEIDKTLVAAYPDAPGFMRDLAVSWDCLAKVREAQEDWAGAEVALRNALEIDRKLAPAYPGAPGFMRDLATSWFRLATLRQAQQDWAGAEQALGNALEIDKNLTDKYPDVPAFQITLSSSWFELGNVRALRQDLAGAEAAFNKALEIYLKLTTERPDDSELQRSLSSTWVALGDMRDARQDLTGADAAFKHSLAINKKLMPLHPDGPESYRVLALSWDRLADVAEKRGDNAEAERALGESLRVCKAVAARWPEVSLFHGVVISKSLRLAQLLWRYDRADEAATLARGALTKARRLEATGEEFTARQRQMIAELAELAGPETGSDE